MKGTVVGVCVGEEKGTGKKNIEKGYLRKDYGLIGDAHAGSERPVSILDLETIEEVTSHKGITAEPGDFAENITVQGLDLKGIKQGQMLQIGEAEVEVIQVGKVIDDSHTFSFYGTVLLASQGCFCNVTRSGRVQVGDAAEIVK